MDNKKILAKKTKDLLGQKQKVNFDWKLKGLIGQ